MKILPNEMELYCEVYTTVWSLTKQCCCTFDLNIFSVPSVWKNIPSSGVWSQFPAVCTPKKLFSVFYLHFKIKTFNSRQSTCCIPVVMCEKSALEPCKELHPDFHMHLEYYMHLNNQDFLLLMCSDFSPLCTNILEMMASPISHLCRFRNKSKLIKKKWKEVEN